MKAVGIRFSPEIDKKLEAYAKYKKMTKTAAARMIVKNFFNTLEAFQ